MVPPGLQSTSRERVGFHVSCRGTKSWDPLPKAVARNTIHMQVTPQALQLQEDFFLHSVFPLGLHCLGLAHPLYPVLEFVSLFFADPVTHRFLFAGHSLRPGGILGGKGHIFLVHRLLFNWHTRTYWLHELNRGLVSLLWRVNFQAQVFWT